jgi:hypothetical protein
VERGGEVRGVSKYVKMTSYIQVGGLEGGRLGVPELGLTYLFIFTNGKDDQKHTLD